MTSSNQQTFIKTDIAIVGGGIAGSTAAVLLQNAGIDAILVDPHEVMPVDFRCEKFNRDQMQVLERIGISGKIYDACTHIEDIWIARLGKLVNKMSYPHYGFSYETAINAIRDYLNQPDKMITSKAKSIETSAELQTLHLANGQTITSRLVIMANGLNPGLRKQLNVEQEMLSKHHEMAIGFDIEAINGNEFGFESFTFWPEKASEKLAYFTAFKSGDKFRVNTFGYWAKDDRFMLDLQKTPEKALAALMPSLNNIIGDFDVTSRVHVRPVDLYQNDPSKCDGVVFVGDAYSTSCPGAGTGTSKAVIDVDILCKEYIPTWLAQDKIDAKAISNFYQDEAKLASDSESLNAAYFLRSISIENGIVWGTRRWMRFFYHFGKGALKSMPGFFKGETHKEAA